MTQILKFIFFTSIIVLFIGSIWPGSLIGYLFYSDNSHEPNFIENPFGTSINHFIYYTYVSLLGFFIYKKSKNFKKLVYGLFSLSILLELIHFFIPTRSLELNDLIGNILGVSVAYFAIKTYLFIINHE
jgi:VanZ family protein